MSQSPQKLIIINDQIVTYGDNTYQYNDDGYLQSKITPNGTITYQYGVFGELQKVVTSTKTIEYLHNANKSKKHGWQWIGK